MRELFFIRRLKLVPALLVCLLMVSTLASAQSVPQPQTMIPSPPQLAAKSWFLMDADSGRVLVEHNADERLPPARPTDRRPFPFP